MRTFTLALVAAAALGSATAAFAQMQTSNERPLPIQGAGSGVWATNGPVRQDTIQDRYDLAVLMLKKKLDRVTLEDGGKLTPEHQASLQAELDRLNGGFRLHRRASFGHHGHAPGSNSAS